MNFLNVTVDCSANGTYLKTGNFSIKLPDGKGNRAEIKKYNGKEVIMGIRPEDLYDDPAFVSAVPDCNTEVTIDLVEMMGAETYLYFQVAGTEFTARVNPRSTSKHGDKVKIGLDANKIHLFDKDTENIITH